LPDTAAYGDIEPGTYIDCTLSLVKHLCCHSISLALIDSSTLAHGNARGILSTLLLKLAFSEDVLRRSGSVEEEEVGTAAERVTNMLQEI
jgi:hypothetical protein